MKNGEKDKKKDDQKQKRRSKEGVRQIKIKGNN
jgi:hypothetical protein